jgi:hypothetical protein
MPVVREPLVGPSTSSILSRSAARTTRMCISDDMFTSVERISNRSASLHPISSPLPMTHSRLVVAVVAEHDGDRIAGSRPVDSVPIRIEVGHADTARTDRSHR